MAGPTLGEIVRSLKSEGWSDEAIVRNLKSEYGLDATDIPPAQNPADVAAAFSQVGRAMAGPLGDFAGGLAGRAYGASLGERQELAGYGVDPQMLAPQGPPMDRATATADAMRTVRHQEQEAAAAARAGPNQSLAAIGAGISGAMDPLMVFAPAPTTMDGMALKAQQFSDMRSLVSQGQKDYLEGTYNPRKGKHPVMNLARGAADIFTGGLEMAGLAADTLQGNINPEQAKDIGRAVAGGAIGAPLEMMKRANPITHDESGLGFDLGRTKEAAFTDPMGYFLAGAPAAKALPLGLKLPSSITRAARRLTDDPAMRVIAAELMQQIASGAITKKAGRKQMESLFPVRTGAYTGKIGGVNIGTVVKQAGVGALLTAMVADGYIDTAVAAAVGANVPGIARLLKSAVPIESRAAVARVVKDWVAQGTPGETQIARGMTRDTESARSEIASLFREFAARVKEGAVRFERPPPDAKAARAASARRRTVGEVMEVEGGEVIPDRAALARRQAFDVEERGLSMITASNKKHKLPDDPAVIKRLKEISTPDKRAAKSGQTKQKERARAPVRVSGNEANAIIDRAVEVMNRHGGKTRRQQVVRWFTDAMLQDGLSLMRSPAARGKLTKILEVKYGLDRKFTASLDDQIVRILESEATRNPRSLILKLGGKEISLQDVIPEAIAAIYKTDKAAHGKWIEGAIRRVGLHMSTKAEKALTARAIGEEIKRYKVTNKADATHLPAELIAERVAKGEVKPMILPESVVAEMVNRAEAAQFEKMPKYMRAMLKEHGQKVPKGMMIKRGLKDTLGMHLESLGYIEELEDLGRALRVVRVTGDTIAAIPGVKALARQAKLGLTALRIGTHINNITGNTLYQSMRLGKTPFEVFGGMVEEGWRHRQFYKGKVTDPKEVRFQRAVQRTGGVETSLVEDDMLHFARAARAAGVVGVRHVKAAVGRARETATRVYRMGDTVTKLHEVRAAFNQIMPDLEALGEGKYVEASFGGGSRKGKGEIQIRMVKRNGKIVVDGKEMALDSQELADLVVGIGMKSALDIAFDYGSGGKWVKLMRGGELLKAIHPFFAWTYYAADIPGVKRGLLSRMLDYSGGRLTATNDLGLIAKNGLRAATLIAKRSALLGAMRAISDKERDMMGDLVGWDASGPNIVAAFDGPSPEIVHVHERTGLNMLEASTTVLRMGPKLLNAMLGGDWLMDGVYDSKVVKRRYWMMGPESTFLKNLTRARQYWKDHEAGRDLPLSKVLNMMGFGAGLVASELLGILKDKPIGDRKYARMGMRVARMIAGGTPTDVVDATISHLWPDSPASSRYHDPQSGKWETPARLWIRKLLTFGVRPIDLADEKSHWANERGAHLRTVWSGLKKVIIRKDKADEDYKLAEELLDKLEEITGDELDALKERLGDLRQEGVANRPADKYKIRKLEQSRKK